MVHRKPTSSKLAPWPAIDGCDCLYCRWRRSQVKKRKKTPAIVRHLIASMERDWQDAKKALDVEEMLNQTRAKIELLHLLGKLK